jgi:hypothetical protein
MKYRILVLCLVVFLCGCSSGPQVKMPELKMLTREQVIDAVTECRDAHLKPRIQGVWVKTANGGTVDVPVNVQCVPFTY